MGHGLRRPTAILEAAAFALVAAKHNPKGANNSNSHGNDNENEEEVGITKAAVGQQGKSASMHGSRMLTKLFQISTCWDHSCLQELRYMSAGNK